MGDRIYADNFNSAAQYFRDRYVNIARENYDGIDEQFNQYNLLQQDLNADVEDIKQARDITYGRALNALRLDSEFYANSKTNDWPFEQLGGLFADDFNLTQMDTSNLGGRGLLKTANTWRELNKDTKANLTNELNTANNLMASASDETIRASYQARIDDINARIQSFDQQYATAGDMINEGRLYAALGDQRKWVAEGLTQGYCSNGLVSSAISGSDVALMGGLDDFKALPTGNWDTVNRDAERLATLEYQYFNKYEKNRLTGAELEARQAEIDKMVEAYPDCTKYEYVFLSDDVNLENGLNNGRIKKVAATTTEVEKTVEAQVEAVGKEKTKAPVEKSYATLYNEDKSAYISRFEKEYPDGKNNGKTSEDDFNQRYGDYIRCKEAKGISLSNDEMKWVVDDFEKNPLKINSASDQKYFESQQERINGFKSKLSAATENSSNGIKQMGAWSDAPSNENVTQPANPYAYTKPVREANMSNADYDSLCKQAEQDHITKVNNEMADAVIRGEYGCGQERFDKLSAAGYDYGQVQAIVNQKMAAYQAQTSATSQISTQSVQADINVTTQSIDSIDGSSQSVPTYDELNQQFNDLRHTARGLVEENSSLKRQLDAYQNTGTDTAEPEELQRVDAKAKSPISAKDLYVNTPAPDLTVSESANKDVLSRVNNGTYIDQITSPIDNTKLNEMVGAKFETNETQRKLAEEFATNDTQKKLAEKFDTNETQDYLAEKIDNSTTIDYLKTPIDNSKTDLYVHEDSKKSLKNRFDTIVANNEAANNAAKQAQRDAETELGS